MTAHVRSVRSPCGRLVREVCNDIHHSSASVVRPPSRWADDDQRFQQQRDGPHAKQALENHEPDQEGRQLHGLLRVAAIAIGEPRNDQDHEHERAAR